MRVPHAAIYGLTLGIPSKHHRIYYSGLLAIIALNLVMLNACVLAL